jgi:hypothetical protein
MTIAIRVQCPHLINNPPWEVGGDPPQGGSRIEFPILLIFLIEFIFHRTNYLLHYEFPIFDILFHQMS